MKNRCCLLCSFIRQSGQRDALNFTSEVRRERRARPLQPSATDSARERRLDYGGWMTDDDETGVKKLPVSTHTTNAKECQSEGGTDWDLRIVLAQWQRPKMRNGLTYD